MTLEERSLHLRNPPPVLQPCGVGVGKIALASLLGDCARRSPGKSANPIGAEAAAFPGEGEERHLPLHGRRPQPARAVRLQAQAPGVRRQGRARIAAEGQALRVHGYVLEGAAQAARHAARIQAARQERSYVSELLPNIGGRSRRPRVRLAASRPITSTTARRSVSSIRAPSVSAARASAPG